MMRPSFGYPMVAPRFLPLDRDRHLAQLIEHYRTLRGPLTAIQDALPPAWSSERRELDRRAGEARRRALATLAAHDRLPAYASLLATVEDATGLPLSNPPCRLDDLDTITGGWVLDACETVRGAVLALAVCDLVFLDRDALDALAAKWTLLDPAFGR